MPIEESQVSGLFMGHCCSPKALFCTEKNHAD